MGFYMKAAGAGFSAGSAYKDAKQRRGALHNAAAIDMNNAQVAEWQAEAALRAGEDAEAFSRLKEGQQVSEQRASLAASGVDLGEGGATDILSGTEIIGNHDAAVIHANAQMQAWADRVQATNWKNEAAGYAAAAKSINPAMSALGSLLGSSGSVGDSWYSKTNGGTTTPSWYQTWMGSSGGGSSSATSNWMNWGA